MSGATFRKSATERTMFSAGRFSPVGLVIAILIDFRCGSADKDAVAKDRIAQSHSAFFLVIVPYWKDKTSEVKQLLSSRAPPQGEGCSVMSAPSVPISPKSRSSAFKCDVFREILRRQRGSG